MPEMVDIEKQQIAVSLLFDHMLYDFHTGFPVIRTGQFVCSGLCIISGAGGIYDA